MLLQDQIRGIEWSRNTLWEVRFPSAPSPFNTWFPATDIEIEMGNLDTESFSFFMSSYSIPLRRKERTISLTFVDNAEHILLDWITAWFNSIVVPDRRLRGFKQSGVRTLSESIKQIDITRLTSRQRAINVGVSYIDSYNVFPSGSIKFIGGSGESKVNSYSVDFIIAGVIQERWVENMIKKTGSITGGTITD